MRPPTPRTWPICHGKGTSNTGLVGITDTIYARGSVRCRRIVVSYRPARRVPKCDSIYYGGTTGVTREEALARAVVIRETEIAARRAREAAQKQGRAA